MPAERLLRWLDGFETRHGPSETSLTDGQLHLTALDGAVARLASRWPGLVPGAHPVQAFIDHAMAERRYGVLLVRRERHAVAVVDGTAISAARVGRHYVQGRTKAGGWSQQRFARRRDNQAKHAYAAAASDVAMLLEPVARDLVGLVTGGDASGVAAVLADMRVPRTAALHGRHDLPRLAVGDPTREALADVILRQGAITVRLNSLA